MKTIRALSFKRLYAPMNCKVEHPVAATSSTDFIEAIEAETDSDHKQKNIDA